jgi:hypothetical protein
MDSQNTEKIDTSYTYSNKLCYNPEAVNKIYILSNKEQLIHVAEKSEQSGGSNSNFEVIAEKDLSKNKELLQDIAYYSATPFNRLAVTDRVITINEKNYNFNN